ncbi:MAG TPA: DNA-directed RNA polymerase subunit omega [Phycisphaerales bacterium]
MIEALKSDAIVNKVGGRFKLTALIQRRLGELMEGHRPLVERNGRTDLEIVVEEIMTDKIGLDFENASLVETKSVNAGSDSLL